MLRGTFDFTAKVSEGSTSGQFRRMIQKLLVERFQLKLHLERKAMTVYELTVSPGGPKLKESSPADSTPPKDPGDFRDYTVGKDGYPVFAGDRGGLAGPSGHYRWTGFQLSLGEIAKTLTTYVGGPVMDATGLTKTYDIDLKWGVDVAWILERSGHQAEVGELPDAGAPGPPLARALSDQLGLKLTSKAGFGDVVAIDHVAKVPSGN